MSYYKDLAFELRLRNYNDSEISTLLAEVYEYSVAQESSPEEAFGKASEYAKSHPPKKRRLRDWYIVVGLWFLGIAFGLFCIFAKDSNFVSSLTPIPVVTIVLPYLLIVTVFAIIALHRLPADSKKFDEAVDAY